jgi:hypothetical protein
MQTKNIDIAGKAALSQNVVMLHPANRIDEKRDIKAAIMARVENVRQDIGETITIFAARMDAGYKDYKGWHERESIDLPYVVKLAQSLNISLDYLCCVIDEPHPPSREPLVQDYWALRAEVEKQHRKDRGGKTA